MKRKRNLLLFLGFILLAMSPVGFSAGKDDDDFNVDGSAAAREKTEDQELRDALRLSLKEESEEETSAPSEAVSLPSVPDCELPEEFVRKLEESTPRQQDCGEASAFCCAHINIWGNFAAKFDLELSFQQVLDMTPLAFSGEGAEEKIGPLPSQVAKSMSKLYPDETKGFSARGCDALEPGNFAGIIKEHIEKNEAMIVLLSCKDRVTQSLTVEEINERVDFPLEGFKRSDAAGLEASLEIDVPGLHYVTVYGFKNGNVLYLDTDKTRNAMAVEAFVTQMDVLETKAFLRSLEDYQIVLKEDYIVPILNINMGKIIPLRTALAFIPETNVAGADKVASWERFSWVPVVLEEQEPDQPTGCQTQ